jgi:hypothetical protein
MSSREGRSYDDWLSDKKCDQDSRIHCTRCGTIIPDELLYPIGDDSIEAIENIPERVQSETHCRACVSAIAAGKPRRIDWEDDLP